MDEEMSNRNHLHLGQCAKGAEVIVGCGTQTGEAATEDCRWNTKQEIKRMASKRPHPPKKPDLSQSAAVGKPDENEAACIARAVLYPTMQAAVTLKKYSNAYGELDLFELFKSLTELTRASNNGDLKRGEAMLTAQAHTLDAIFNNLAQRAAMNMSEHLGATETYLKLALRAQSQCRATWEALSTIKNPPIAGFVNQANIANGPQQVNNAPAKANEAPRTREKGNPQNKLLEENHGEQLDTGTTGTAGGIDPEMATVGKIERAKDTGR